MDKLIGLTISFITVLTGAYIFTEGASGLSSGLILVGIGLTLHYERRIIKETSTGLERMVSTTLPVLTELIIILSIILSTGFLAESVFYLAITLLLTELINRYDSLFEINRSRLLGRISRVIILSLGIGLHSINEFLVFYGLAAASITVIYDIAVLLDEARSGI